MKAWTYRILRAAFMAVIAWVLYQVLDHFDQEWLFFPIVVGFFLLWVAEQGRRTWSRKKKEADWDRWEASVADPAARPNAIREVRAALAKSERFGTRLRQEQAHLSVILAELLDAGGRADEAVRVLAKVDLAALTPSQAVVVRHARVVAYLSANMLDDAEVALKVRAQDSGEPDMDARLDLLDAMVAVERGDTARAAGIVKDVEERFRDDPYLAAECRVARAVVDDAKGDRDGAVRALRELDATTLESLAQLGPPRVRPLAAAASATSGEAQAGDR